MRLILSPLDLSFARDQVLGQLNAASDTWIVDYDKAFLGISWDYSRPWLRLENVLVINAHAGQRADIPELRAEIALTSLLGTLELVSASANNVRVTAENMGDRGPGVRADETALGENMATKDNVLAKNSGGLSAADLAIPTKVVVETIENVRRDMPSLRRIALQNLQFFLLDERGIEQLRLVARSVDLALKDEQRRLDAVVDLPIADQVILTHIRSDYNVDAQTITAGLSTSNIRLQEFTHRWTMPAFIGWLDLPLDLAVSLELSPDIGLVKADILAELQQGFLQDEGFYPDAVPINGGSIDFGYDPASRSVDLRAMTLALEDVTLAGRGQMIWPIDKNKPVGRFTFGTDAVSVRTVLKYWPIVRGENGASKGARAWIDRHMIDADATNVAFHVEWNEEEIGPFLNQSPYELTFDFKNLDSFFLTAMPPVTAARGKANLTSTALEVAIEEGDISGLTVQHSDFILSGINIKDAGVGHFNLALSGDAETLMHVLDHAPIRLGTKTGIVPERMAGDVTVAGTVKVALKKYLRSDELDYSITAKVSNGVFKDVLGGKGITDAAVIVQTDPGSVQIKGDVVLNGIAAKVDWYDNLALGRQDASAMTAITKASFKADASLLKNVKVPVDQFLSGPVSGSITFAGRGLSFAKGTFALDASEARFDIPELSWTSQAGRPLKAEGKVQFNERSIAVTPFKLLGDEIHADLQFEVGQGDAPSIALVAYAHQLGRHSFKARIDRPQGKGFTVDIDAKSFDLEPYLLTHLEEQAPPEQAPPEQAPPEQAPPDVQDATVDTFVRLKAESLLLTNGEKVMAAVAKSRFSGGEPQYLGLVAEDPDGGSISLVIGEDSADEDSRSDPHALVLNAANGGQLLRGLGYFSHLEGGDLHLTGTTSGWGQRLMIDAVAQTGAATLLPKSALAEEVTSGTLDGIDEYIEDGVALTEVIIPFNFEHGLIDFSDLRANGPTLGVTLEGQIDTRRSQLNLNGVLVPAYGINSLLGNIPLVGTLLTGGKGEGLFAFAYRVKGDFDNPDVSVSRLSGLAPGFLRGLFKGAKGKVESTPDSEMSPQPAVSETSDGERLL